jgi:hypothetical protein
MSSVTSCPDCQAFVRRSVEACPHCGCLIHRGFLGRAGLERFVNVTVLILLMLIMVLVLS